VLLDRSLEKPLDYAVPDAVADQIQIGARVEVPLKGSVKKGTVAACKETSPFSTAKAILRVIEDGGGLSPPLWRLALWMARYYATPLSRVLNCFIPPSIRKGVKGRKEGKDLSEHEFFPSPPKTLHAEQQSVLAGICATLDTGRFGVHLVQGVTGSGKTEVYLQAIQHALDLGKSALLLVPEVALTSQTIERFRARFQQKIALFHHKRSLGEKSSDWHSLKERRAMIALGARSALFCPAQNLGLIIVDEEHDSSYKQSEEMPCYHARDVAVMRGQIEQAAVVLGSATPSLESRYNAELGKYTFHRLMKRATSASIPQVQIVDMQRAYERSGGFTHFSPELIDALQQRLEKGEQTLLLLNKRGYYRMQVCKECRAVVKCPHCDLALTFHKADGLLRCHLCNATQHPQPTCVSCGSPETLQFKGFGTEHAERSLKALFPTIRTLRMDRDTTSGKEGHETLFKQFRAHKADVLIGTQMIAKGFHFPSVTLVGVLNADPALHIPDFRSAETLFQLLTQVAGRAGRAALPGEVIIQTFLPDHPLLQLAAAQDFDAFYASEIEERRLFAYPPFCRLIKIGCTGPDEPLTAAYAQHIFAALAPLLPLGASLFPPQPAGHAKVKDLYRYHLLLKIPKTLQAPFLSAIPPPPSTKFNYKIDIDPISTFF
jgi:primosomal protein N' (replication factor Y)